MSRILQCMNQRGPFTSSGFNLLAVISTFNAPNRCYSRPEDLRAAGSLIPLNLSGMSFGFGFTTAYRHFLLFIILVLHYIILYYYYCIN